MVCMHSRDFFTLLTCPAESDVTFCMQSVLDLFALNAKKWWYEFLWNTFLYHMISFSSHIVLSFPYQLPTHKSTYLLFSSSHKYWSCSAYLFACSAQVPHLDFLDIKYVSCYSQISSWCSEFSLICTKPFDAKQGCHRWGQRGVTASPSCSTFGVAGRAKMAFLY